MENWLIGLLIGALGIGATHQRSENANVANQQLGERPRPVADSLRADPETGLAIDEHLTLVKAHCTGCHSPKLIVQNRFTRDGWRQKIRWMQRTQNLWDLGEAEPAVLDYLTKHYGPDQRPTNGRRQPLKPVQWYPLDA